MLNEMNNDEVKMKRNGIIRYAGIKYKQNTTLTVQ